MQWCCRAVTDRGEEIRRKRGVVYYHTSNRCRIAVMRFYPATAETWCNYEFDYISSSGLLKVEISGETSEIWWGQLRWFYTSAFHTF